MSTNCKDNEATNRSVETVSRHDDPTNRKYFKKANVNGSTATAYIDAGSADCLMRTTIARKLGLEPLPTTDTLKPYGPSAVALENEGIVTADVTIDGVGLKEIPFYVVPDTY